MYFTDYLENAIKPRIVTENDNKLYQNMEIFFTIVLCTKAEEN